MKIIINKDILANSLSKVITAVNQRSTLPILSNILFEAQKGKLKITGTDLEIGIKDTIDADVIEEGSITIPAKKISDIVRESPEKEIEISVSKSNAIAIKSGKAYFKLMGLPKDDYPKFPQYSLDQAINIEQESFKECVKLTSFAISADETRYVLNGALIIINKSSLKMVATDGRRLAFMEKGISSKKEDKLEMIIPTKAIHEVNKNIGTDGVFQLIDLGNQVIFKINDTMIVSRLIEGHFPNYEQVIPKEEKITAKIDRVKLLSSIRRVSLLTSMESQAIKIDLMRNGKLILSSRSPNVGESKEEIDVEYDGSEEITIGFNPVYMIDVLKNLQEEKIDFFMSSPEKPGVIKIKEKYVYVIMPMQIG